MTASVLSRRTCTATVAVALTLAATATVAQTVDRRYALRPIKCVGYDPRPSDYAAQKAAYNPKANPDSRFAYFDSDYFNGDFKSLWGDGTGARDDLGTFKAARINLLHLYDWNAQRTDHKSALDAAQAHGIKVMVPISNYMWQTLTNTGLCDSCKPGYAAALALLEASFVEVYDTATRKPHPAAAMWSIFNEYDLNGYDPQLVRFVAQAILTLEAKYGIAPEDRLPITSPVSDAVFPKTARAGLPRPLGAALDLAASQWLSHNPGKSDSASDLPGGLLATLAIANALEQGQTIVTYKSMFESANVTVAAIPADFWKTRWIAATNPFRKAVPLQALITDPGQFMSGFPGTTNFNTLPPLFFGEMGFAQGDTGSPIGSDAARTAQAQIVLDQIVTTNGLTDPAKTTGGYFLGSCFFQHTLVDPKNFQGFDVTGSFTETTAPNAPYPANGTVRIDALAPLPVWQSVQQGYASALTTLEFADWITGMESDR